MATGTQGTCSRGSGTGGAGQEAPHLRNILQALQLVVLSNVYIWKLWWLALALSGLMFDLMEGKGGTRLPEPQTSGQGTGGWGTPAGTRVWVECRRPGTREHPGHANGHVPTRVWVWAGTGTCEDSADVPSGRDGTRARSKNSK